MQEFGIMSKSKSSKASEDDMDASGSLGSSRVESTGGEVDGMNATHQCLDSNAGLPLTPPRRTACAGWARCVIPDLEAGAPFCPPQTPDPLFPLTLAKMAPIHEGHSFIPSGCALVG